jgi:hypothetical protein
MKDEREMEKHRRLVSTESLFEHIVSTVAGSREVTRGISQQCTKMVSALPLHHGRVAVCFLQLCE